MTFYVLKYAKYYFNNKKCLNLFFINLVLNIFNLINFTITINYYIVFNVFRCYFSTSVCKNIFVDAEGPFDINRCQWRILQVDYHGR
jgi:hypothetical protein